jgi:hypothetical protein
MSKIVMHACDHCEETCKDEKGLIRLEANSIGRILIFRRNRERLREYAAEFHPFAGEFCSRKCLQAAADLWITELMHLAKDDA